jgi:hypothetical protein
MKISSKVKSGRKRAEHPSDKANIKSIKKGREMQPFDMPGRKMKGEVRNRKEENTVSKGNEKPAKIGGNKKRKNFLNKKK